MPVWRYSALDAAGARRDGVIDATARSGAVDQLLSQGLTPLSVDDLEGAARPASRADRLGILRILATLLQARVPVASAFRVAATMVPAAAASRMATARDAAKGGAPLSRALGLAGLVNPTEEGVLSAGEASGKLVEALNGIVEVQTRGAALRSELISAAIYPAILIVGLVVTLGIIFGAVLPVLRPVFEDRGEALPSATYALLAIDDALTQWGALFALGALALAAGLFFWIRSSGRGAFHRALLRWRIFLGLPRDMAGAAFARALATMLDGGMALAPAIDRAAIGLSNLEAQAAGRSAAAAVKQGRRVGDALEGTATFPVVLVELARAGEETGRLGPMCAEAALILEQSVRTRLARIASLFSPIATLLLGLVVGFVMTGVVGGILAAGAPGP